MPVILLVIAAPPAILGPVLVGCILGFVFLNPLLQVVSEEVYDAPHCRGFGGGFIGLINFPYQAFTFQSRKEREKQEVEDAIQKGWNNLDDDEKRVILDFISKIDEEIVDKSKKLLSKQDSATTNEHDQEINESSTKLENAKKKLQILERIVPKGINTKKAQKHVIN